MDMAVVGDVDEGDGGKAAAPQHLPATIFRMSVVGAAEFGDVAEDAGHDLES